jgi:hypothetical protein
VAPSADVHERDQQRDKEQRRNQCKHDRSREVRRTAFLADVTQRGAQLFATPHRDARNSFTAQGIDIGGHNSVHGMWTQAYQGVIPVTHDFYLAAPLCLTR